MAVMYELQLTNPEKAPEWLKRTLPIRYKTKLQAEYAQKKCQQGVPGVFTKIVMIR